MARDISRDRNGQHGRHGLKTAHTYGDFVTRLYLVGRFCRPPIKQNKTRVAKLLGHRATRAQTTKFEEEIETHH